jgi:hypothetical protein
MDVNASCAPDAHGFWNAGALGADELKSAEVLVPAKGTRETSVPRLVATSATSSAAVLAAVAMRMIARIATGVLAAGELASTRRWWTARWWAPQAPWSSWPWLAYR